MKNKKYIIISIIAIAVILATVLIYILVNKDKNIENTSNQETITISQETAELVNFFKNDVAKKIAETNSHIEGPETVDSEYKNNIESGFDTFYVGFSKSKQKDVVLTELDVNCPFYVYNNHYETKELDDIKQVVYTITLDEEVNGTITFDINNDKYILNNIDISNKYIEFLVNDYRGSIILIIYEGADFSDFKIKKEYVR